jgi:hypothetical protein
LRFASPSKRVESSGADRAYTDEQGVEARCMYTTEPAESRDEPVELESESVSVECESMLVRGDRGGLETKISGTSTTAIAVVFRGEGPVSVVERRRGEGKCKESRGWAESRFRREALRLDEAKKDM